MKTLAFSLDTRIDFSTPVHHHNFLLRFVPVSGGGQTVTAHTVTLEPRCALRYDADAFGNCTVSGSLEAPHGFFHYGVEGCATVDLSQKHPEEPHPMYRFGGRLTTPDDALKAFAESLPLGGLSPAEQALRIREAVNAHFTYTPGATGVATTAAQSFAAGQGVCQDYAQVMAVLCRLWGLPARYCAGYTVGEGATHAWCEVNLPGEGWVGYDPTRNVMVDESYLRVAVGRDYGDCPLDSGTFRSPADQTQTVFMRVWETE